jgi:hypothetical protein
MILTDEQLERSRAWRSRGLTSRAANAVVRAGMRTVDEIRARGRASWLLTCGVGRKIVAELEQLYGGLAP